MKSPEFYSGREQTYVKHFFLERYLEQVAYHILSFQSSFIYVDGFSGPWRSVDEQFSDTSFSIAVETLRKVRSAMQERLGKPLQVECVFIEKSPEAFEDLQRFVKTVRELRVDAMHGEFESAIPALVQKIGRKFSFVFIDPTGWTGFGMRQIQPLLALRGEVLINFMFHDINRFLDTPDQAKARSYDRLYGGTGWFGDFSQLLQQGWTREDAVLDVYASRVKTTGSFPYVTSTRIKSPTHDRTYFHLVYATRNWKGINVFRHVEEEVAKEQERVDAIARHSAAHTRDEQGVLFANLPVLRGPRTFDEEQRIRLQQGRNRLNDLLRAKKQHPYKELSANVQQIPLVWERYVKDWLEGMHKRGEITIQGLRGHSRRPNPDCVIVTGH